jgi:hypothetical protein
LERSELLKMKKPAKMTGFYDRFKRYFDRFCRYLSRSNCVDRAGICTGSAIGAFVGIDDKLIVSLADCFNRAGGFACAAGNAFAGNYIGHDSSPSLVI